MTTNSPLSEVEKENEAAMWAEYDKRYFRSYGLDTLAQIERQDWLLAPLFPQRGLCMIYGPPGIGKSFLALDIAMSCAGQHGSCDNPPPRTFHKLPVMQNLVVAMLVGEGPGALHVRNQAWRAERGELERPMLYFFPLVPPFGDKKQLDKLINSLNFEITSDCHESALVIVDTLMMAASGLNVNDPAQSQLFIDACHRIRLEANCTVLLVHHTGKDRERGALGAENLKAALHTMHKLEAISGADGEQILKLTQEKSKDSALHEPMYFQKAVVSLPSGETSLVLRRISSPSSKPQGSKIATKLEAALAIIEERGESGISAKQLAVELVSRTESHVTAEDDKKKATDAMRKFLMKNIAVFKPYAHRRGISEKASWHFSVKKPKDE